MLPSLFHSGPSHHSARGVPPRGASRAAPARGAGLLALRDLAAGASTKFILIRRRGR